MILILAAAVLLPAKAEVDSSRPDMTPMRKKAVATLRDSLQGPELWPQVKAAEALLLNSYDEGIREKFLALERTAGPPERIGVWRVLAQAQGNDRPAAAGYVSKIREVFLDPRAPDREHALEALAKLGQDVPGGALEQIVRDRASPLRAFAQWVLANRGKQQEIDGLVDLLRDPDERQRARAAYALRFLGALDEPSLARVRAAAEAEPAASAARIYMLSGLFVHAKAGQPAAKEKLLAEAAEGNAAQRTELGYALASAGGQDDLPLLGRQLGDTDAGVRIAAANAVLRIERRQRRGLTGLDWLAIGTYAAGMVAIGLYYSRKQRTTESYFLGDRNMKPFAVGISLFATLFSSISYLAHPGEIINHGPVILCNLLALPLAYVAVGYGLIPSLMRQPITSAYEILQGRLGPGVRLLGSLMFVLTRLIWMALMLYLTSRVVVTLMGWPPESMFVVVLVCGLLTMVYTSLGGLRGVVITDVVQFFVLLGAALLTIVFVTRDLGGIMAWFPTSWSPTWDTQPFFSASPMVRATVVGAVVNAFVFWVCTAGSDQMAIQRYLASRDVTAARRAFLVNAAGSVVTMLLLAAIGFALLAYFRANPQAIADGQSLHGEADFLFPHFMTNYLPPGIGGLSLAGIFAAAMSSLSSGMNSISTVVFVDFLPRIPQLSGEDRSIRWAKWVTAGIGVFVVLLSLVMDHVPGNLQEVASKTSALFLAPLFILFFMALFVPFATPGGAVLGAIYSFLTAVLFGFWDVITGLPALSFQWIAVTSLVAGLLTGPLFSYVNSFGKIGRFVGWATMLVAPAVLGLVGWSMLALRPSP